jgi:hypothetical protein
MPYSSRAHYHPLPLEADMADDEPAGRGITPPDFVIKLSPTEKAAFESRLLRKIDYRLLPMAILMYILNYLDRNNIASARIAGPDGKGLQDELNLSSTQYQVRMHIIVQFSLLTPEKTAISILFVGYLLMQGLYPQIAILVEIYQPSI